jgi:hypothetical protein
MGVFRERLVEYKAVGSLTEKGSGLIVVAVPVTVQLLG